MELVKNIFFNTDRLTANSTIKISYSGKFFQENCEKVVIHYGFGNNWNNLTEAEMQKTNLGFQTEVDLINSDTFNFCLKNEKNEWDNNDGFNYIFNIEHPEVALSILDDKSLSRNNKLRKSYLLSKKIRITIYKLLVSIPRLISGNYKKHTEA